MASYRYAPTGAQDSQDRSSGSDAEPALKLEGDESAPAGNAPDADPPADKIVISLRGINKTYTSANGERAEILKDLNLDIEAGSFNVIRGVSGSGKTSLLRILGMLDSDFEGDYVFAGESTKTKPDWYRDELRANNLGFIFQDGRLFGHLGIRENISIPIRLQGSAEDRRGMYERITTLAPTFFTAEEIEKDILLSSPGQVSGGQKQRAAIMRSIVNRPAIVLADEPTASLDESRKQEILQLLTTLCEAGHTVIVVSHDNVFYQSGRQLALSSGTLQEVVPSPGTAAARISVHPPASGESILYGWRPRAPLAIIIRQAIRETFLRPIFLFLILVSLCAGVSQIGVFASVIVGAQAFLDDAMTKGSRLNRLEIRPRTGDVGKDERFPVVDSITASGGVQYVIPRRATLLRVVNSEGKATVYSAMGLHGDDPEYRLLSFVAGGPFTPNSEELEIIVTVGLLSDLFADSGNLANGTKTYADFIGRSVEVELPQFSKTGEELKARAAHVKLRLAGIILHAEGGRQIYLPNRTQLVFDRYKMDRLGEVVLPLNDAGDAWSEDRASIETLAAFPWEDQLHVYTRQIRDIIPVFQQLSQLGYKPHSDIWNYKWVLDLRDLAWNIFIPLLALIVLAVGLTVATNLFSSAKLREAEFALWRVLGMRRGDLILSQILSTIIVVFVGAAIGLLISGGLIGGARSFLAEQNPDAGLEAVFAPVSQFAIVILVSSVLVGLLSAIYPAIRTAHADPAKVLQS